MAERQNTAMRSAAQLTLQLKGDLRVEEDVDRQGEDKAKPIRQNRLPGSRDV